MIIPAFEHESLPFGYRPVYAFYATPLHGTSSVNLQFPELYACPHDTAGYLYPRCPQIHVQKQTVPSAPSYEYLRAQTASLPHRWETPDYAQGLFSDYDDTRRIYRSSPSPCNSIPDLPHGFIKLNHIFHPLTDNKFRHMTTSLSSSLYSIQGACQCFSCYFLLSCNVYAVPVTSVYFISCV